MDAPAKPTWREALADSMSPDMAREIDLYETQMDLRRQGKVDEKLFAETRLRRGAYGQRYDNGRRHDGEKTQEIGFPKVPTKGPDTEWHAPGMQRIKIPFGGMTTAQLETLADVAEEYSDAILHVTTRQDIQLHFVHIDDTPDMQRRLAAVGITTREACGNSVRNVTGCPLAGICRDEAFDITPYANAVTWFLLGHRDVQDFGRKFKIAFSGCEQHACGLTFMHDLGCVARTRVVDGREQRGFEVYVGGGLGAVPYQAKLFDEFLPEAELLPIAQAISRIYARYGEKRNRAKSRIKFLIAKQGIEEFRRLVLEERATLPEDPRWTAWLADLAKSEERPLERAAAPGGDGGPRFEQWHRTNVYRQRQAGFVAATVTLPLGDLTSQQARALADICRRYVNDTMRTTVEQNILLRWVHEADLPALYGELDAAGLGAPGAETIVDVTSCPGTDTCKLGIASSRGLAGELRRRLAAKQLQYDQAVKDLRIKVSGCFNSCGQHHVAEIGFYGVSRTLNNYKVPHFQLILGGEWRENGKAFGLAMAAVPSRVVPEAVDRLLDFYLTNRGEGETFRQLVTRISKKDIKALLKDLSVVPPHAMDPSYYTDWGDAREFTLGDMGVGECAGEIVTATEFGIAAAEGEVFEAQLALDEGREDGARQAADKALSAMLLAAQALIKLQDPDVSNDQAVIADEFRRRFYDTQLFFDPYAGGKFAHLFFHAFDNRSESAGVELAHRRVEEAQLFIEAAHACYSRILDGGGGLNAPVLKGAAAAAGPAA